MNLFKTISAAVIVTSLALSSSVIGGPGHDHGDEKPMVSGTALPRFASVSDLFELVGILDGKRLVLYLDDAATNAPIKDAKLELEIGGNKVKVEPHGLGEFEVMFDQEPKDGVLTIAATVSAGKDTDLLATELDIHSSNSVKPGSTATNTTASDHTHKPGEFHFADIWSQYKAWINGTAAAAILIIFGVLRARRRSIFSARSGALK
jgi:hypothetical protein